MVEPKVVEMKIEYPGDIKEGIWSIRKIKDGTRAAFLVGNLEDLPKAMTLAQLEPYRAEIGRRLLKFEGVEDRVCTIYELITTVFQVVADKKLE